jgi:hypothetical protein
MKNIEQKIPLPILFMSLFFPNINYQRKYGEQEQTINLSKGEIEKFNLTKSMFDREIGDRVERLTWGEKMIEYDTTWVHLGYNYFKQISKIEARSC